MTTLIRLFWNICLLRLGPEFVPPESWFVGVLLTVHLVVNVAMLSQVLQVDPMLALNLALILLTVSVALIWAALHIRRVEGRFPATLGAVLGTSAMIGLGIMVAHGLSGGAVRAFLQIALSLWSTTVFGFILHRALDCRLWIGIALSLGSGLLGTLAALTLMGPWLAEAAATAL